MGIHQVLLSGGSGYTISPSSSLINEGTSVTFTIRTTGVTNGTVLYWTTTGILAARFIDNITQGTVVITNNTGTVVRTVINNFAVDGITAITMQLHTSSYTGTVVSTSPAVTINDTSLTRPHGSITITNASQTAWVVPVGVNLISVTIQGGGGGGGGNDGWPGHAGYAGDKVTGTLSVIAGETYYAQAGQGGSAGYYGSSAVGGAGGAGVWVGGRGGYSGAWGYSGSGGGGGGASIFYNASTYFGVAGGGGGGGGGGNRGPSGGQVTTYNQSIAPWYAVSNGAWCGFLNTYGIWTGGAMSVATNTYTVSITFPVTGAYKFYLSNDNYGAIYVDGTVILQSSSFTFVTETTYIVNAGTHTLAVQCRNASGGSNNPAGIGVRILTPTGTELWHTRQPNNSMAGALGQDKSGDGGGGGGGGAGYPLGGGGGHCPAGDVGGYSGNNGKSYVVTGFTTAPLAGSAGGAIGVAGSQGLVTIAW